MLWPRLSPELSCVCCRSRRRLGRLRARPASHCNLDRIFFRYQNERRSRLLGGLFLLRNVHRLVRNPASPVFSPALGPIRTARNGLSAVGRDGLGRTSRLPRRTLWVRLRFQSRRPRPWSARSAIRDFGRPQCANSGRSSSAVTWLKTTPSRRLSTSRGSTKNVCFRLKSVLAFSRSFAATAE